MTLDRSRILDAMTGKIRPEDADLVADILCRTPESYLDIRVLSEIEQQLPRFDIPKIAPCRPAVHPHPKMIELPSRLFNGKWLRRSLNDRLGPVIASSFYARIYELCKDLGKNLGYAASEPIYLSAVLREVFGPAGLRERADAVVFAQPVYGALKHDIEPILEKYIF